MYVFKSPLWLLLASLLTLSACQPSDNNGSTEKTSTSEQKTGEVTLTAARAGFQTKIVDTSFKGDGTPATPPKKIFNLIRYPAKDGDMAAYVTPDPKDGKKHPAVIWLIGGYGGIGNDDFFWQDHPRENDQSGGAFRKAGIVMMTPSFRAENDNPGHYEMFYGELDDLESARAWLAKQPYVDPQRIYVVGHSTGGTRALLASELSDKYRAVFSLGGIPDLKKRIDGGSMMVAIPFDQSNPQEFKLRSPGFFISSITRPTFYFEGEEAYWDEFDVIRQDAQQQKIPLQVYKLAGGDHFSIIAPVTELIAKKILADNGPQSNIAFSEADINGVERELRH